MALATRLPFLNGKRKVFHRMVELYEDMFIFIMFVSGL